MFKIRKAKLKPFLTTKIYKFNPNNLSYILKKTIYMIIQT